MKKLFKFAVAVLFIVGQLNLPVYSQESVKPLKLAKVTDEELTAADVYAYLWDQTVVTVSRREQKISEAPASVTVITAEDIKRSGALNIHDLLRPVMGLDVAGLIQTGPTISMRGFNTALVSRTILVLLNGNPIYQEVSMAPFWSMFPLTLQEIDRIEIVRGPGSALWGANAYSAVMNIITKSPDKSPTFQIAQSVGDIGTIYTNVTHAYNAGNLRYRIQYEGDQIHNVALNPDHFAVKRNIYKMDLQYITNNQRELSLTFGYNQPTFAIIDPAFLMFEHKGFKEFLHFTYKAGDNWLKIRQNLLSIDNTMGGIPYQTVPPRSYVDRSVSIETQMTNKFQKMGILTYGTEYKFVKSFFMGPERTQGLGSIFAQHDIPLNKKLSLVTGARVDTHPQVKTAFSPRLSLMYAPSASHSLRLTGATSYRRPSYTELYANSVLGGLPIFGNENILAERIQSVEFGYVRKVTEKTKTSITLFRNVLDNFIRMVVVGGVKRSYMNLNKATQNGAEWELETFLTNNLKGFVNYAFDQTKNTQTGGPFEMSPKHKVNAGLGWMPKSGPYSNLAYNYVDDTGQTLGPQGYKRVEPYRNVDVNFGYRFSKKLEGLEMGLNAQNVFNKKRKEHPAGDTFKRRVVGTLSYAF